MKKISILFIILLIWTMYSSCKRDDGAGPAVIDLEKTAISKVMPLLKEATELFNSGNKITASTKAEQARDILNAVFSPGRKVVVSPKCPLKHIISDDSMIIMALSCGDFINKQPQNPRGAFEENMMMFTINYKANGAEGSGSETEKSIADKIRKTPAGTTFTGTLEITDPGVLMEAEENVLCSYSMSFNAKLLDVAQKDKK